MHYKKDLYGKFAYLEKQGWEPIRAARRFLKCLISTEELLIRQKCDGLKTGLEDHRSGNQLFYVRDRTTAQHHVFFSEADLRIWLDQRHYSDTRSPNLKQSYHRQRWLR